MSPAAKHVRTTVDDTPVHARRFGDGPRAALLVHGLASENRELGDLAPALAALGLTVLTPDLRGHGRSGGARGVVAPERARLDLDAWCRWLEAEGHELVLLGGHSLGGCWALQAAANDLDVEAVAVLSSPARIVNELTPLQTALYNVGGLAHRVAVRLGHDGLTVPYEVEPEDVLDDPEAVHAMVSQGIIQRRVPLANVQPLLALDATAWARRVQAPALYAVAANDRVVAHENTRQLFQAHAGPKDWIELPGPHSSFFGPTGPACARPVAEWAEGVLS